MTGSLFPQWDAFAFVYTLILVSQIDLSLREGICHGSSDMLVLGIGMLGLVRNK